MGQCTIHGNNCHSHFKNLRPSLSDYKISKHLTRDIENYQEFIDKILSCEATCSSELHKFEEKIDHFSIFRAKIDGVHLVYAIDDSKKILFLRAFKNFTHYGKFLEDKKAIKKLVESLNSAEN